MNSKVLNEHLKGVADAIREKKGTTDLINPQDFAEEISTISGGGYTGHADAEGLRAIGWTEEDIAYYQENGVNWNEEDDQYHKVTDVNKALYGVLTADNIADYKDIIVYLPKIDTSNVTDMSNMFTGYYALRAIPKLDTSSVTYMSEMFAYCPSLSFIPKLDTSNVTDMRGMFSDCASLRSIPQLDTSSVTTMSNMFYNCYALLAIPKLDTSSVTDMSNMFAGCYALISIPQLDTSNVTDMSGMFAYCPSLSFIPKLDTSNVTDMRGVCSNCASLTHVNLKNAKQACDFSSSNLLSKDSLLYLINNEAATSAITIRLSSKAYTRLAEDPDIVAALTNHPNITILK